MKLRVHRARPSDLIRKNTAIARKVDPAIRAKSTPVSPAAVSAFEGGYQ